MKKKEKLSLNFNNEHYRKIGENAASNTLVKHKNKKNKINLYSPGAKLKLKEEYKIIPESQTRDISHLQDLKSNHSSNFTDLPTDIDSLKHLLNSSDHHGNLILRGSPVPPSCRKTNFFEELFVSKSLDKLQNEKKFLGSPSGRQECKNLKKWLETMKKKYCSKEIFSENGIAIYSMCAKELNRQVSVNCKDRGSILQETLNFFKKLHEKACEKNAGLEKKLFESKEILVSQHKSNQEKLMIEIESLKSSQDDFCSIIMKQEEKIKRLKIKLRSTEEELKKINEFSSEFFKTKSSLFRRSCVFVPKIHKYGSVEGIKTMKTDGKEHSELDWEKTASSNSRAQTSNLKICKNVSSVSVFCRKLE